MYATYVVHYIATYDDELVGLEKGFTAEGSTHHVVSKRLVENCAKYIGFQIKNDHKAISIFIHIFNIALTNRGK